jgi:imidazolonepropionase-like amidohydrolase
MKRTLTLVGNIVLVLFTPQLVNAQWSEGQEGQLVIRGGWLFDSVSDERRPNTGILIRGGKIVAVDADIGQQALNAANVIDLAGNDTILPGMVDLHAHYNLDLVPTRLKERDCFSA